MAGPPILLDTDVLSAIMRRNPKVLPRAKIYLSEHERFTVSVITRYEILRGLKTKGAIKQAVAFDQFCERNTILPLTDEIVVKAAEIYADLSNRGKLIGDADIIIAASALVNGLYLVTNNLKHFKRIPDLHIETWLD